ncbi:hypothetical protein [Legionella massiliensis]|nr:hypothetical protein [Legionella massiliensis]
MQPSIKIVANQTGHTSHTFVLFGYEQDDYSSMKLETHKDEFFIVDLWLYALSDQGELGCGVYTYQDYPRGFLSHVKCVYDNHQPFTRADWQNYLDEKEGIQKAANGFFSPDPKSLLSQKILNLTNKISELEWRTTDLEREIETRETQTIDEWGLEIEDNPSLLAELKQQLNHFRTSIVRAEEELQKLNEKLESIDSTAPAHPSPLK